MSKTTDDWTTCPVCQQPRDPYGRCDCDYVPPAPPKEDTA